MKSLARGLEALDHLVSGGPMGVTQMAELLDIDKGSASRLLKTLELAGYAHRAPGRRYAPVLKSPIKRTAPVRSIRQRARPLLERLVKLSGESAHLAVRADDLVLYLDREVPDVMLRADRPIGALVSIDATALGRVFLAFGDAQLPAGDAALQAKLERFRLQGYAEDDQEFSPGVRCVAAPIREADGQLAGAISISGPTLRVGVEMLPALGELVKETALLF